MATDQNTVKNPQQSLEIHPDEFYSTIGANYGLLIGRLTVDNLELRKQIVSLSSNNTQSQADQAVLAQENTRLINAQVILEDTIHELELKIANLTKANSTQE